tara:strand:+ start:111 stop:815 length:705 start_codon:yes stop_codon:yes gene_type:complete
MSIRKIDTAISTIRSLYDENGNYLPSGNYFFSIKDYERGLFTGEMTGGGHFGDFTFSPRKLIKMMAVGQSRLARRSDLQNVTGMPNYPSPLARNTNARLSHFSTTVNSPYVVRNYSRENVVLREPEKCSICLEDIRPNQQKSLNCNHSFHKDCINTWLREKDDCPLCRAPQRTRIERRESREDPFMSALNELSSATSRRNLLYNRYETRDYRLNRNSRTLVFPSSSLSSRYSHK